MRRLLRRACSRLHLPSPRLIVTVHLASGQTLVFKAASVTVKRHRLTNELTEIEWTKSIGAPLHLRVENVVAVVNR